MDSLPTIGIVRFPGANCEQDCLEPLRHQFGVNATYVWHQTGCLDELDAVILPGGFSYGDYLRSGALAAMSPVLRGVRDLADAGKPVLGVCNGFQVLTESGLLPGGLVANRQQQFLCESVALTVEPTHTPYVQHYQPGQTIHLPIAHAEGRYVADDQTLAALNDHQQVVFRYQQDVNGSCQNIAGICNRQGNVLGMMPHPERALNQTGLTTADGHPLFVGLLQALGLDRYAVVAS